MALQQSGIWASIRRLLNAVNSDRDLVAAETEVGSFLGDTVYRKVLTIAAGPDGMTPVTVAHGVTGLAKVVALQGSITDDTDWIPLAGGGDLVVDLDDTNLNLDSTTDYSGFAGEAILLYTKA